MRISRGGFYLPKAIAFKVGGLWSSGKIGITVCKKGQAALAGKVPSVCKVCCVSCREGSGLSLGGGGGSRGMGM